MCLDEQQEAVLFPYLLAARAKAAITSEAALAEQPPPPIMQVTVDPNIDPGLSAAQEATRDVLQAESVDSQGISAELEKDMFQAALVYKASLIDQERLLRVQVRALGFLIVQYTLAYSQAKKGQLSGSSRLQTPWDREAWPRAAWWVRGLGSFGVEDLSECPVPTPFVALGDFIAEVGRWVE